MSCDCCRDFEDLADEMNELRREHGAIAYELAGYVIRDMNGHSCDKDYQRALLRQTSLPREQWTGDMVNLWEQMQKERAEEGGA